MSSRLTIQRLRSRSSSFIVDYILPFGWLCLLTGMFWVPLRGGYHQFFYVLVASPTLLLFLLDPRPFRELVNNPLFRAFGLFGLYMMLTLLWAEPSDSTGSLVKRPLYIAMLLFSAGTLTLHRPRRMERVLLLSAVIAVVSAVLSLAWFFHQGHRFGNGDRLPGYGALYNPLLTAHVYGSFASLWMARWFLARSPLALAPLISLLVLGCLLLATGSRTPLLGLVAATGWLFLCCDKSRGLIAIGVILASLFAVLHFYPEALSQRGTSFRPDIWHDALRQIGEAPWFGHGYDTPITIDLPRAGFILSDPHNILLGVLYAGGATGLLLWFGIYACALCFAWRERREPLVLLASSWLVFGFVAGLTEGMAFMSRPKEHWFLIWIPLALIYALWLKRQRTVLLSDSTADARCHAKSCGPST
ncbi:O-Antigen ligase [compost metagenome]